MTTRRTVDEFMKQKNLALVGASSGGKKFGNTILREMSEKGYAMHPVHPTARNIDGMQCRSRLADLPEEVTGLILVIPPEQTELVVKEVASTNIGHIWMQQGAQSDEAVRICNELGVPCIAGECILMFAEPVRSLHALHRWIWKVLGKLPADQNETIEGTTIE